VEVGAQRIGQVSSWAACAGEAEAEPRYWRAYGFILLLVNFLFFYHSCKTLNLARIIPPTFGIDVSHEKLYAILVHGPTAQGYMIIWICYSRMELTVYGISVWRRMLGYI